MTILNTLASTNINTGNTLWVDAVNGNDLTGVRGRQDKPYLTLASAQTAASSGDCIHVRPGAYTITASLGKNGVNWWFEYGTTVTFSTTDNDFINTGVFHLSGFAATCKIGGYGSFIRTTTAHTTGTFSVGIHCGASAGSMEVECLDITVNDTALVDPTTLGPRGIYASAGTLRVRCRTLTVNGAVGSGGSDTSGAGIWWDNGEVSINARQIVSTGWGFYNNVTGNPTGDLHVTCDDTRCALATCYSAATNSNAAAWLNVQTLRNTAWGTAVQQNGADRMYVTAQKIFGAITNSGTGLLYVNTQKVSVFVIGIALLNTTNTGTSWIVVSDWDTTNLTSNAMNISSGTVDIFGGVIRSDVSSLGVSLSGGTVRFHDTRIDASNNSATNPIILSGTQTSSLATVELVAAGGRDCITASSAQSITFDGPVSINTTINSNVTVTQAGAYGTPPLSKPTVTGSKGGNAALTSLMTALVSLGLVKDTTT